MNICRRFTIAIAAALMIGSAGIATAQDQEKPEAPTITSIVSNGDGTITMHVADLKPFINSYGVVGFPTFTFHRAEGRRQNADGFEKLDIRGHGVQDGIFDTIRVDQYNTRGITITGLRRGEHSFYIRIHYAAKSGHVSSDPSNVVTVTVMGTKDVDGDIRVVLSVPSSGVDREFVAPSFAAYPNPATNVLNLSTPDDRSGADVRVYDVRGNEVLAGRVDAAGSRCSIDVASLPSGAYYAIVSQGEKRTRTQFNVAR